MNILLVITMGTQKGPKIIVKVLIEPFKGPKLSFIMVGIKIAIRVAACKCKT